MKKMVICILMLVTSSLLLAQQKPSFQDYLNKTKSLSAFSNPIVPYTPYVPYRKSFTIPQEKSLPGARNSRSMTLHNAKLYGILSNGNKLYRLPLDKMICIVPDMSQFHMPVIGGSDFGDRRINVLDN